MQKFTIDYTENNIRLDIFLAQKINLSRNKCQLLINKKQILINNKIINKKSFLLKQNDKIMIKQISQSTVLNPLEPINLNLQIVYEDNYLVIINKPHNLIVHPSSSYTGITLINGLLYQIPCLKKLSGSRPGIIHRLDKDTTGLMIIGKTESIINQMQILLKEKKITKTYWALIEGFLAIKGTINLPIKRDNINRVKMAIHPNGKNSITHFHTLRKFKNYSLLEINLETGRTHQIRTHLAYLKHPICGDLLYGKKKQEISLPLLHAKKLSFTHPITMKNLQFEIPLSNHFKQKLDNLI
ncbi:MAG: RluA family pseudouridine synthase [Vigna little leaf phytoplasma]|nr:RluA family pseudouridine synthase [Vigna little leaf phytoplasma]